MTVCHLCGKTLDLTAPIGRREICPFCRSDLRCCRNCSLYEPNAPNACREPQAENIVLKERGNFCDFFRFRRGPSATFPDVTAGQARVRLESLFRKPIPEG